MEPPDRVESDLKNLLSSAAEWTLADDHQICNILYTLASNIEERGNSLEKSLNNLRLRTGKLDAAVQCLNVDLSVMKNSKFIEIVIDEDEPRRRRAPVVPPQKTNDEKRDEVISTVKSCINESLKFAASSQMDMRLESDLPPLIGSKEFMEVPVKQPTPQEQPGLATHDANKHPAPTQDSESEDEIQDIPTTSSHRNPTLAYRDSVSMNGTNGRKTPSPVQNVFVPPPPPQPAQKLKGGLFDYDSSDSEDVSLHREQPTQNGENTEKSSVKSLEMPGESQMRQDTVVRPPTAAQLANAVSGLRSVKKTIPDEEVTAPLSRSVQKPPPVAIPKADAVKIVPKPEPVKEAVSKSENNSATLPVSVPPVTSQAKSVAETSNTPKPIASASVTQKPASKSLFDDTDSDEDLFKPVFQRSLNKSSLPITQKVQKTDSASDAPKTDTVTAPRATNSLLSSRAEKYKKLFDSDSDGEDLFKSFKAAPAVSKPVKQPRPPSPKAPSKEPLPQPTPTEQIVTAPLSHKESDSSPLIPDTIETPRLGPLPVEETVSPVTVSETPEASPLSLEPTTEAEMPIKPTKTPGRLAPSSIASLLNAQLASGPPSMRRSTDKEEKSQPTSVIEKPEADKASENGASGHLTNPTLTRPRPPSNRKRPSRFAGSSVSSKGDNEAIKDGIGNLTIDAPQPITTAKPATTADLSKPSVVEDADKAKTVAKAPAAAPTPRKGLFDSDSDDDLFSGAKKPLSTMKKTNGTLNEPKTEPKKKPTAGKSLFDSDDEDLSLFRKK